MKKFFSAFLLMAAVAFSVSTFVACNDVVGEIEDVKAQTTANAAAIESLKAEIAKLDTRLVAAQKAADDAMAAAVAAQETGDEALAEAQAAKAAAAQAEANAIAYTKEQLQALQTVFEAKVAEIETALAGKVDKTEFNAAIEQLNKDVKAAMDLITNNKKELDEKISALLSADEAINKKIDELNIFKTAAEALHIEITENIDSLATELAAAQAEIEEVWAAIYDENNGLFALIGSNASAIQSNTELIEALQADLDEFYASVYGEGANSIMSILNSYYNLIQDLNEKYNALDLRVQSLVYVPEYSDHKATLDWATVAVERGSTAYPTVLAKATEIKYLVKAEDAVKVAASIAEKPEVLDFVVKGVETRAEAEADLEIVDVVAEGEYIIVSVVAKNFENKFYENAKEGCYSAALVFDDEENTRTTEFVNLVPAAEYEQFEMGLLVPGEDDAMRMATAHEVINYLMVANDYKTVKTAVKPVVAFVSKINPTDPASYFTAEFLAEEGYDLNIGMKINITDGADFNQERSYEINEDKMDDPHGTVYFDITESPKYNYNYKVQEGTDFDYVGKKGSVKYEFTCGDAVSTLTYEFELANAQVDVTVEKTIDWSIAFADKYIVNKKLYSFNGFADADTVIIAGADQVHDLADLLNMSAPKPKYFVKGANGWDKVKDQTIVKQHSTTDGDYVIALQPGSFKFNNSYKTVYTSTVGNVDYNIAFVVNLTGYQESVIVELPVEFKLDGKNPEFVAPVALADSAYVALTDGYDFLGYGDKNAETWDAMFQSYVEPYGLGQLGYPVVNGTKSNWVRNLLDLAEARIMFEKGQLKQGVNTITWEVSPVKDFTVKFVVSGEIVTPLGTLLTADSYVVNGVGQAKGMLDENGVYSIIESHLPYYFNVDGPLGDHNYTVTFEVEAPNATATSDVALSNKGHLTVATEKDGSYYPIEGDATLNWNTYTGLTVNVTAKLYANGYLVATKDIVIETYDPLTFTVADVTVQRVMRENTSVQVFKNAVLTSLVQEDENLIVFTKDVNGEKVLTNKTEAFAAVEAAYGVNITIVNSDPTAPSYVYYWDNAGQNKVYLPKSQYSFEDGILTINGDDTTAKNYHADFTVTMTSRICAGPHTQNIHIEFVGTR
ncbi:MAG: hypothetical protein UD961_14060 [Bacteroidales bacterium]|nr:hypothetical protein [Bacteroidales bacterium]